MPISDEELLTTKVAGYCRQTLRLLKQEALDDSGCGALVVCGGDLGRTVLRAGGFENVVISNFGARIHADEFSPFACGHQDGEHLTIRMSTSTSAAFMPAFSSAKCGSGPLPRSIGLRGKW